MKKNWLGEENSFYLSHKFSDKDYSSLTVVEISYQYHANRKKSLKT
jgi:hypothetical protein